MARNLDTMEQIMAQKEKDIAKDGQPQLTAEVRTLAEQKRFTFDIIAIPTDPLR